MDAATYAVESEVEQTHWWFVVRRNLIRSLIIEFRLGRDAAILDLGTATGTNLRLLKEMGFSNYRGLDLSPEAAKWCAEKNLGTVHLGDVCAIPFPDNTFDLVLATDIIEHVDDDLEALREIRRVLKNSGRAVITVPAFQSLWGLQDEVAHHKRRYRNRQLLDRIRAAGLECPEAFYFNFLLFLPIWFTRQIIRLSGIRLKSENQLNTPWLNRVLKAIFSLDVTMARAIKPPFGVSFLALVSRVKGPDVPAAEARSICSSC